MTRAKNQIIVSRNGNSWLSIHISSKEFDARLDVLLHLTETTCRNFFWVLDLDGSCVAAQPTLTGALKHINDKRILVHHQPSFV